MYQIDGANVPAIMLNKSSVGVMSFKTDIFYIVFSFACKPFCGVTNGNHSGHCGHSLHHSPLTRRHKYKKLKEQNKGTLDDK